MNKIVGLAAAMMITLAMLGYITPVMAAKVTYVRIQADMSTYSLRQNVRLTVRASYDTSGLISFGACVEYKILIKEVKWLGLYKKEITQRTYQGSCYIGAFPNPVTIEQTLGVSASQFGKGNHQVYAEVWFASAKVFGRVTGWEKGTSPTIQVTIK